MRRRMLFVLAATALAAFAVPAVPALAGGGHGCSAEPTTGSQGDVVEIADGCFGPSTLRIAAGDTVTFVNEDPFQHNVSAIGWGHSDPLHEGDAFEATFRDDGIYPFACQYHPAMVGAIVVGDGTGGGNGEVVTGSSFVPSGPANQLQAVGTDRSTGSSTTGWVAGGAIGLAAGLGIGLLARKNARANAGS
jgi:plastocyanin